MKWNQLTPRYIENRSTKAATKGCWLWAGYIQSSGYGQVYVEGARVLAHRLSWLAHKGAIADGLLVLHKCDRRSCVNPEHLFLGTHIDNRVDCISKERAFYQRPGVDFWFTRTRRIKKLTDDQVREIRASIEPLATLAKRYGVSMACVSTTRRGKRKQLVS